MNAISPHAALIYVMVVVSASDGNMSDNELAAIGNLVKALPAFRGFDEHRLLSTARECGAILQEKEGLDAVLGLARNALSEPMRETAYWLALEIALSDARVELEEIRVIELIRRALGLDRLVSAALERAALSRFRAA